MILLAASAALGQTEFSAQISEVQQSGATATNKIYFGTDSTRIELHTGNVVIVNLVARTSSILTPEQHSFFTGSTERIGAGTDQIYALLRPDDVENACDEWMKIKFMHTESCRKAGSEVVEGRRTVKYEGKCSGEVCYVWIDRDLRVPVRSERKWSSSELRDIVLGALPAVLFEIPTGYIQKFSLTGTISTKPQ